MMETMESSFYHDTEMKKSSLKNVKSNMTLDFSAQGTKVSKLKKINNVILNSPDINLLKLASPELERMIIQQGALTTTPTPTTQILFPKSVTEEQEAYARGFVDALAELHSKQPGTEDDANTNPVQLMQLSKDEQVVSTADLPQSSTYTTLTTVSSSASNSHTSGGSILSNSQVKPSVATTSVPNSVFAYTTVAQLPGSVLHQGAIASTSAQTSAQVPSNSLALNPQELIIQNQPHPLNKTPSTAMQFATSAGQHSQITQIKEEPQRVPSLSPQLTPINMEAQEGIKLERKRARNRVAARKCRTRKLERISRLEERVDELKGQNTTLVQTASQLREQVFALKQQILEHVSSGCKVMLSANML